MTAAVVQCPTCEKTVVWRPSSSYRPFCSELCRLIDLGEWATGNRYIPSDPEYDDTSATDPDQD